MKRIFRFIIIAMGMVLLFCSILYSQTAWRGTVSTAWDDDNNWTNNAPTATSTVTLGDAALTRQPTISSAVTIAALNFRSTAACSLTIGAGGSLAVTGDVSGTWTGNRTHLIAIGAQSVSIGGNFTAASANNRRINVTISTGSLTVTGNYALNNNSSCVFSGAGNLYLAGNFTGGGTFTRSTSTVTYNGTGAQTIANKTYYNLTINNTTGTTTLAGNTTITGNLVVNGTISGTANMTLSGAGRTIDGTGSITSTGTFTMRGGTMTILSTANLSIAGRIIIGSGFASSTITNNGTITSTSATGITAALGASTWVNAANSTLNVAGPLLATGTLTADANPNTVNYNGTTAAQTIKPTTYHHLTITKGTQTATLSDVLTVNGDLTISSGILDASTFAVTVYGNFTNSDTFTGSGTILFSPATAVTITLMGTSFTNTSMVEFGGSGLITVVGTAPTINILTISNTHTSGVTLPADWTIGSDVNIQANALLNGGSYSHSIGGSWNNIGTFNGQTSTITFTGATQTISGTETTFNNLVIAPTASITANTGFNITGNLAVNGTLDVTGQNIIFIGSGASIISGTLNPITLDVLTIAKTSATTTLAQNINGISQLSISSGSFDISTFTVSEDAGAGALQIDANAVLRIDGPNAMPSFTTYNINPEGIVEYYGSVAQTITPISGYGSLLLTNSGIKTIDAPFSISGNMTISTGAPLSMSGVVTLGVGGNWQNDGIFTAGSSTVQFTGISKTISGTTIFNNLDITGSSTNTGSITVSGTLSGLGTLTQGTNSNLTISGSSVTISNLDATASGNTVTYDGTGAQSILAASYYNLTMNNTGTKTAGSNCTVYGDLFIDNGSNLTINNGVTIQVLGKTTTAGLLNNSGLLKISD